MDQPIIQVYCIVWDVPHINLPDSIDLNEFDCVDPYNFTSDTLKGLLEDRYGVTVSSLDWNIEY